MGVELGRRREPREAHRQLHAADADQPLAPLARTCGTRTTTRLCRPAPQRASAWRVRRCPTSLHLSRETPSPRLSRRAATRRAAVSEWTLDGQIDRRRCAFLFLACSLQ